MKTIVGSSTKTPDMKSPAGGKRSFLFTSNIGQVRASIIQIHPSLIFPILMSPTLSITLGALLVGKLQIASVPSSSSLRTSHEPFFQRIS